MSNLLKSIVFTTIHPPSDAIREFSKIKDWDLISVGDLKTPKDWKVEGIKYLPPEEQEQLFPKLSRLLNWDRYARKNIGYLYAIKNGSEIIAEIDDDIAPYKNYPPEISETKTLPVISGEKFVNIYDFFGSAETWPRGYPISMIAKKHKYDKKTEKIYTPIQNSLLDQNGDFDAIYRLVSDKNVEYQKSGQYALAKGVYCPFHSGNTFWYPKSYMVLYMPVFVNPHVEDIWRGYIAQRLIWEINGHLTFIYPTVYTNQRNKHDYLKDFEYEMPMFLQTEKLINILDSLSLSDDLGKSLIKVYKELVKAEIMDERELNVVTSWVNEVEQILGK